MIDVTTPPTPNQVINSFESVRGASVKGILKTVKINKADKTFKFGNKAYLKLKTISGGLDSLII